MCEGRIRLLFVSGQFVQGGSERFLFEVCRALDPRRYSIDILTWRRVQPTDYYYRRLEALGITIHRKLPQRVYFRKRLSFLYRWRGFQGVMDAVNDAHYRLVLGTFLDQFGVINVIQIENYLTLQPVLANDDRVIVYLMSNGFQYSDNIYAKCWPGRRYRFVLSDPLQKEDLRGTPCAQAETTLFPLALDCTGREQVTLTPPTLGPVKIGIFMRLSPERPLEPLFYCFHDLAKVVNATLHVYGSGDPAQFSRVLQLLGIEERVTFEGHTADLERTLKSDDLSLVWMTSHGPILGYASLEVASFGVPIVFWNLSTTPYEQILDETSRAVHSFDCVTDFVNFNVGLLTRQERLVELGPRLRAYVHDSYDIHRHIATLEDYFARVLSAPKSA